MMKQTDTILTKDLVIGYDTDLIKNISICVAPGRILTLIGPNGSGKSTLLKTITGELKARGGRIILCGQDMLTMSPSDIARSMSVVMTQTIRPELMTCMDVAAMGRYPYTGRFGRLSEEDMSVVRHSLELTGTLDIADRYFDRISDGQRQRVMLARAICQQPDVLVLDEPTSYLDIRYKLDILGTVRRLADEEGVAVIMSLHELEAAVRVSDMVAAVGDGMIKRIGTPAEVFEERFIRGLYGIEDYDISLLGVKPWLEDAYKKADLRKGFAQKPARLMIQGTMSGVGKSLIAAGLCRIFTQDGYSTAPFKSQNMALNSYVTDNGLEMGRAQVMQAECCKREPVVYMNPVLLKPTDDSGSQVIVNGVPIGNMRAAEYFKHKTELIPDIMSAYERLSAQADIIVIEGAGSPAELNLKSNDIVNMGLAALVDAPVLMVGDIDRGGVFAQLTGTLNLLDTEERERVKGLIVNKFRGDRTLFDDGVRILEEKGRAPVLGVVPFADIRLEDEDSLTDRFRSISPRLFDICIIRYPRISNFTDFDVFEQSDDISVRYEDSADRIGEPDILILPGTKNTIDDLRWLRSRGIDKKIYALAASGVCIIGICGGYQMLGDIIEDPDGTESGGSETGLGLLKVRTRMRPDKHRQRFEGSITDACGILGDMRGVGITGYEIHNGDTYAADTCDDSMMREFTSSGTGYCMGNIYGTYIHGVFDAPGVAASLVSTVSAAHNKAVDVSAIAGHTEYKERMYDRLADILRDSLDMDAIYAIMGIDK